MNTGTRIKLFRLLNGLTQQELSEAVKTEPTYLVRYERGPIVPPTRIVFRLSEELGIEPKWLVESSTAPFVFLMAEPLKAGMTARQITGISKSFQELFPAFLEDSNIDAFCKIILPAGAAYCFAFHCKDSLGLLLPDGSVLILILPKAHEKEMDRLMAEHVLVNDEPSGREVSLVKSIFQKGETNPAEEDKALQSILDRLRNKGAAWINTGECVKAWRQRLQIQGTRTEWIIPVNFTISSRERISREDALRFVDKTVKTAQKKLPEGLIIMADYKKR
jgi:transcriptional regulator with XRE-family HTH domain